MALPLKLHKRFLKSVDKVYGYLRDEWSNAEADDFIRHLEAKLQAIRLHPQIGSLSDRLKNVRTLSITRHNRLFYKTYPDRIAVLYLKDTRRRRCKR